MQLQAEAKRNEENASNLKSELDVALNEKHELVMNMYVYTSTYICTYVIRTKYVYQYFSTVEQKGSQHYFSVKLMIAGVHMLY